MHASQDRDGCVQGWHLTPFQHTEGVNSPSTRSSNLSSNKSSLRRLWSGHGEGFEGDQMAATTQMPQRTARLKGPVQLHDEGVAHGRQHIALRPHILPMVPRQDAVLLSGRGSKLGNV